jgi:hypothetical protein
MRPGFRASKLTVFLRARLSTVESYRSGLHGRPLPARRGAGKMMQIRALIYGLRICRNCKAVSCRRDCGSSGLNFIGSDPS